MWVDSGFIERGLCFLLSWEERKNIIKRKNEKEIWTWVNDNRKKVVLFVRGCIGNRVSCWWFYWLVEGVGD